MGLFNNIVCLHLSVITIYLLFDSVGSHDGKICFKFAERDSCIIAGEHENITLAHGQEYDDGCETVCRCDHGLLECIPYCVEPSLPLPTPLCPHPVVTKLREGDCCKVIACHDLEEGESQI